MDRDVAVPRGLAARVLSGLEAERALDDLGPRAVWPRSRWAWAAAAGLLLAFAGWAFWRNARIAQRAERDLVAGQAPPARKGDVPDPQMLATLDVLENWDLLVPEDVDVVLSTLGPADEALLEYQPGDAAAAPPSEKKPPEPPAPRPTAPRSKG